MVDTRSSRRAAGANAIPDFDTPLDTRDDSVAEDSLPNQPSPPMAPLPPSEDQSISAFFARKKNLGRSQKPSRSRPLNTESISCIGEIPADGAKDLTEAFEMFWGAIDEKLDNYPEVGILSLAKETLNSIRDELQELNEFREVNNDSTATIMSFSSLTWPKLQTRLGVKPPLLKQINSEMLKSILDSTEKKYSQLKKKDIYNSRAWDHSNVLDNLEWIDDLVLKRKEASARISINEWVLELGKYLKTEGFWVLIIPELTVQDARDRINSPSKFATINYNNMTTALTGVADYALVIQSERDWNVQAFDAFRDAAITALSLVEFADTLEGVNIIVVEAKDIVMEKLEMHVPQVVGQCIAIMRIDPQRQAVPFYLTNGKIWIFGIVARSSSGGLHLYESFVLPTFDINAEDIPKRGTEAETDFNLKYNTFLRTMVTWAKLDPREIADVIVKELGPSKV